MQKRVSAIFWETYLRPALSCRWAYQRQQEGMGTILAPCVTCPTSETSPKGVPKVIQQARGPSPHPLEPRVDQRPSSYGVHSMHGPELKMRNAAQLEAGKSKLSPANHRAEHMHVKDGTVVCSFLSKLNILHVPL